MCLTYKFSFYEKKKWLASQSTIITAYKIGYILEDFQGIERIWPPYQGCVNPPNFYVKHNTLPSTRAGSKFATIPGGTRYIAYFHLFAVKEDARAALFFLPNTSGKGSYKYFKCHVKKEHITSMGFDMGRLVIVTRSFEIVDPNAERYFKIGETLCV